MRVYIAGPYTKGDVAVNVRRALLMATRLLVMGHAPYVPHLNHLWHLIAPQLYDTWLALDMEWLTQSEAVVRLDGESEGADKEVAKAEELGIPVYPESDIDAI